MLIDSPLPELQVGLRLVAAGHVRHRRRPAVPGAPGIQSQRTTAGDRAVGHARRARPGAVDDRARGSGRVRTHGEIWMATADERLDGGDPDPGDRHERPRAPCRPGRTAGAATALRPKGPRLGARAEPYSSIIHTGGPMVIPEFLIVIAIVGFYLLSSIKILNEYERGVIFRLGKLLQRAERAGRHPRVRADRPDGARQPADHRHGRAAAGRHHPRQRLGEGQRGRLLPGHGSRAAPSSRSRATTTRLRSWRRRRCAACSDRWSSTTCCRSAISLNRDLQQILDQRTEPWGVKVSSVEVKQVDLPPDMQRAMAKQAEAEREKRAKIVHAAGELEASEKLARRRK